MTGELREAAATMRDRAYHEDSASTSVTPWRAIPTIDPDNNGWVVVDGVVDADYDNSVARCEFDYQGHTAAHIASWHPAVALAVADWLDALADQNDKGPCDAEYERGLCQHCEYDYGQVAALALARLYLGTTP